ncbi:MAG: murein biosynthesis integral membrane protein MurJ [Sphingopyxis sp.]
MGLVRSVSTIGSLTLVSRFMGMARDIFFARYVGAGMAADAFLIAWRLPNLFRALFAEGALAAVFVPMFNRRMAEGEAAEAGTGLAAAQAFAGQILSVLVPFMIAFTAILMLLAGPIVMAMTGGFADASPEKYLLTRHFAVIMFPYLGLISIVSLLGGVLNSLHRFWVNAAAPILLNLALIIALMFFHGPRAQDTAQTQAIAVTIAGVVQLAWLVYSTHRAGVSLKLAWPKLTPDVKTMLMLMAPAAIGQGAIQINILVSTSLAARFLSEGAPSWLYYADRLNQLPLGIIGIGVGTAILPMLSRQIASDNVRAANHTQNRAIELAMFLALPAAAALVCAGEPIIRGLLQHGIFTSNDTRATAAVLGAFALGIPAYVLIKVLTPGFYARQDTKTPVRLALVSMLVNLVGNLILIWPLGPVGVGIATAIAAWVNVVLLYAVLHRRGHLRMERALIGKLLRILLAAAAMGAALWYGTPWADGYMVGGFIQRAAVLALLCGAGATLYALATLATGAYRIGELKALLHRSPAVTEEQ